MSTTLPAQRGETSITTHVGAGGLAAMPIRAKLMLGVGIAALVAIVAAIAMWGRMGDWRVLYANLADKDAGAIVSQLAQMNVPYRHAEGGQAILIPADKVHDVRIRLAQAGLPKGSVAGFELMDSARFGQTQFQERLTFQRGLEGELVRSIGSLAAVQSARVHLAMPQQNGFFREQQKPSASVLVALHPGRSLDRAQIAGIVHLVSSSVAELTPKAVSILDQSGALLWGGPQDESQAGLDPNQLQHVRQIEASLQKRLIDILEPVVGRDNLRATVTAELDFTQTEATSETFKPNQGAEAAAVRSAQTSESSSPNAAQPSGVPGAASNQPPVPATAPLTAPAGAASGAAAAAGAMAASTRREAVTNYEVDKTVRVTRNASGIVKRLNVAVVVNHRNTTDDKGATSSAPLAPEEVEKLTALAQEAIGFNKERGDSLKVVNAAFHAEPALKADPLPIWKQSWLLDMLRAAIVPSALTLLALLVVFMVIRPALKTMGAAVSAQAAAQAAAAAQVAAVVDDQVALPGGQGASPNTAQKLMGARELAKQNPEAVAGIVRGWVNNEAAA